MEGPEASFTVKWPKPIWHNIWQFLHGGLPPSPAIPFLGMSVSKRKKKHTFTKTESRKRIVIKSY